MRPSSIDWMGASASFSSRMSPTISSRMSSSVTSPAVPPNSSLTMAMCSRFARMSVRIFAAGWFSTMNITGWRTTSSSVRVWSAPSRTTAKRSFT